MARRQKTNDMSNDDTPGKATRFKAKTVILDYRGTVGRGTIDKNAVRNDRPIPHRLSPLMAFWPVNGVADLQLQPGCNVVEAETWAFYTEGAKSDSGDPGHPQIVQMVKSKSIRVLERLPDDPGAVHDLIDRSMSAEGLKWIADQVERDDSWEGFREELGDAVKARLAKIRPVVLKPMTFKTHAPLIKDPDAPQPSLAMG